MTDLDRLMREAEIDKARGEVVRAAKAWLTAIVAHDSNKVPSDDFGYAMDLERRQAELEKAVDELLKLEEKR